MDVGVSTNADLLIALSSQQNFRRSVLKGANTKWCAASSTKCALNNATQTNVCNLCQILPSIEQDILGLEVHMNQLHSNRQPQARPGLACMQMQPYSTAYMSSGEDAFMQDKLQQKMQT